MRRGLLRRGVEVGLFRESRITSFTRRLSSVPTDVLSTRKTVKMRSTDQHGDPLDTNQPGELDDTNQPGDPLDTDQPGDPIDTDQPGDPVDTNQSS